MNSLTIWKVILTLSLVFVEYGSCESPPIDTEDEITETDTPKETPLDEGYTLKENVTMAQQRCLNLNGNLLTIPQLHLTRNVSVKGGSNGVGFEFNNSSFYWFNNVTRTSEFLNCFMDLNVDSHSCSFLEYCNKTTGVCLLSCQVSACENCLNCFAVFYICAKESSITSTSTALTPSSSDINQLKSTLSSSDFNQPTATPSLSDVNQPQSTLLSSDINQLKSTLLSSDFNELKSTDSSSDFNQLKSTLLSSDFNELKSTDSSSDFNQLKSTPSSSNNNQLKSTPSSSDINQLKSTPSSSDINQLKSTPSSSDINQLKSISLVSASPTETNIMASMTTKISPIEGSEGKNRSISKQVDQYEKKMDGVDINNNNSLLELINITSNYIAVLHARIIVTDEAEKSSLHISNVFERRLTDYAKKHLHNGSLTKLSPDFVIHMRRFSTSSKTDELHDYVFPQSEKQTNSRKDTNVLENVIVIPKELFTNGSIFIGVLYYTLDYVLSESDERLNSKIISAEISPKPTEIFERNITFTLKHRNDSSLESKCVFISNSKNTTNVITNFSSAGCSVVSTNDSHTTCTCNHLTSFAVLTRVKRSKHTAIPAAHSKALSFITYIGLALSLLGVVLTVASYVLLIGLKTEQAHLHTNLALSLGLAQVFFLVGIHPTSSKPFCLVVASLIHYFYLVTFCWMACEGYHLYLMVVKVFAEESYLKTYYLISWITPLIVVVMSIVVAASTPGDVYKYILDDICWVSAENNFIWSFLAPVLLVCLVNLVFLFLVVKEMTKMNKTKDGPSLQLRKSVKACLLLFPILGTTWVFCILTISSSSLVFEYIFNILNSLQLSMSAFVGIKAANKLNNPPYIHGYLLQKGFIIFLFHVVRSTEIHAVFRRKRIQWGISFDMSNSISTVPKTESTIRMTHVVHASESAVKPVLPNWVATEEHEPPDLFYQCDRKGGNQVMPSTEYRN